MKFYMFVAIALFFAVPTMADTVIAKRTIRANAVITAADIGLSQSNIPGSLTRTSDAIGLESRVMIYAGRPVMSSDIGPPAVVDRNQIVTLFFRKGGLIIATEGRSMSRASAGETVRAVNLASRLSVSGRVQPDGNVVVTGSDPTYKR